MAQVRCSDFLTSLLLFTVFSVMLLGVVSCRGPARVVAPEPLATDEIAEHIAPDRSFDHRPYEMIWADREPETEHLADFERLLGWSVEAADGVQANLDRSQAVQLWGEYVGLLRFEAAASNGWVRLVPVQPIRLHDPADTSTIWLHQTEDQAASVLRSRLALMVKDADGTEHQIDFGPLWERGWRLLYARWPAALRSSSAYPIEVMGLKWTELPTGEGAIYLDALSLFVDAIEPIRYPRRPRRPVPLRDGQLEGINQGEGELAFPTVTTTIIPISDTNHAPRHLDIEEDEGHVFSIKCDDQVNPSFRVTAGDGLERIDVVWDDVVVGHVSFELEGLEPDAGRPVVVRKESDQLYLEYARGDILRFSMREHTLAIDAHFRGRAVSTWRMAISEGEIPVAWISVPYLSNGTSSAPVLGATELDEHPLFVHVSIDPYRSNASRLEWRQQGREVAAIYEPVTDGRRNDAHERFIITAAPRMEQVLPAIPNAPGQFRDDLAGRIALQSTGDVSFSELLRGLSAAEQAGLGPYLLLKGQDIWRQNNDSRSFRKRANPHIGGDRALSDFMHTVTGQTNGRIALYTHSTELSPLNAAWSHNALLRQSDATWQPAGAWAFAPRPVFSLTWWSDHLPTIHERFAPSAYWFDGLTTQAPWTYTDFDRRVPGAGTFSQVLFAFGDLIDSVSAHTSVPVLGDAVTASYYGGLLDGVLTRDSIRWRPYNPYHKLYRMQPLTITYGPPLAGESDEQTRHHIADQLAYGNALALRATMPLNVQQWRAIHTLRPLQVLYAKDPPSRLMYSDGDQYVRADEAFANGLWQRSWLYTQYGEELELWVNGHVEADWSVQAGGRTYVLPPSGWLAKGRDVFAFSGWIDDTRVEVVRTPTQTFVYDAQGEIAWDALAVLLDSELPAAEQWEWIADDLAAIWRDEP